MALALAHEQHLVEPQRLDDAETVRVVVDKGRPLGDDRIVDGVPVAAELPGDPAHAARTASHLLGDPPSRPIGHLETPRRDAGVLLGPRTHRARGFGAPEPTLVPDETGWTAEQREVHELDSSPVLHVGDDPAGGTTLGHRLQLDVDPDHAVIAGFDKVQHDDAGKSRKTVAPFTRSLGIHGGSLFCRRQAPSESQNPHLVHCQDKPGSPLPLVVRPP